MTVEPFPGDVPEVSLRVARGEATKAVRRVERLLEHFDAFDRMQEVVDAIDLLRRREVETEGEAAEAVRRVA